MQPQPLRLTRAKAGLVVVDLQERLLPAIARHEAVIQNAVRLVQGAAILGLPILVTEQYRKGLGPTALQIAAAIPDFSAMEKLAFSACGAPGFQEALKRNGISDVLLCGIETHVCICQTCLDLLQSGFRVFVAGDAVSSRALENHQIGLERMHDAGAIVVSVEMALFELLGRAGSEEFKRILNLVK